MSKRKETLEIEDKLYYMCHKKRIYGCEEVTIGFVNSGYGNEIVDFITMDSKGILKCYEIKVTLSDLKSKAKKSWFGHYNYLFVTEELYKKIYGKLEEFIPDYVGVAIPCLSSWSCGVEIRRTARKQDISKEQELMLKESMVRSMSYKIQKYRNASDVQEFLNAKRKLDVLKKECEKHRKEAERLHFIISTIERILRRRYDWDIDLEEVSENVCNDKICLPETIHLRLNARGKKVNQIINEIL